MINTHYDLKSARRSASMKIDNSSVPNTYHNIKDPIKTFFTKINFCWPLGRATKSWWIRMEWEEIMERWYWPLPLHNVDIRQNLSSPKQLLSEKKACDNDHFYYSILEVLYHVVLHICKVHKDDVAKLQLHHTHCFAVLQCMVTIIIIISVLED